jgi:hypothetical protein
MYLVLQMTIPSANGILPRLHVTSPTIRTAIQGQLIVETFYDFSRPACFSVR